MSFVKVNYVWKKNVKVCILRSVITPWIGGDRKKNNAYPRVCVCAFSSYAKREERNKKNKKGDLASDRKVKRGRIFFPIEIFQTLNVCILLIS
jgi:hypothetical protein